MKSKMIKTHSFPYRFYSYKVKNLTPSGKLFYLKSKLDYLSTLNPENLGKFLFCIRCKVMVDLLIKELDQNVE